MSLRVAILLTDRYVLAAKLRIRRGCASVEKLDSVSVETPPALQEDTALGPVGEAIGEAVRRVEGLDLPADLIVPASWCYTGPLDSATGSSRRWDPSAAAYQLEEFLPLPLEEVTCAFACRRRGPCWGLAVRRGPVQELLDDLQARRVPVEHLRVDLFAALAGLQHAPERCPGLVVQDHGRVSVALWDDPAYLPKVLRVMLQPQGSVERTDERLQRHLELTQAASGVQVKSWAIHDLRTLPPGGAVNADPHDGDHLNQAGLESSPGVTGAEGRGAAHPPGPCSMLTPTARCGPTPLLLSVVEHPEQPDLRTGALAAPARGERLARQAQRAALLLLVLLGVGAVDAYVQRTRCRRQLEHIQAEQVALFKSVFPDKPVPANPALRLASERIRLEALTQSAMSPVNAPQVQTPRYAVLDDLRHLVAGLPQDLRMMLLELNLDAEQLTLRGQTVDHRDAERMVETLNQIPNWAGRPARTSRLAAGGVEFAIRATRRGHDRSPERSLRGSEADLATQ